MRIIIELPDAAGEKATIRQESVSTTTVAPTAPTEAATAHAAAEDGGTPSQQMLSALGSGKPRAEEEVTPQQSGEPSNIDGGSMAPWLENVIKGGMTG